MRPLLSTRSSFAAETVEKVERLLEVLATLGEDVLERARLDPVMQWMVQNLRKRPKAV